MYGDISDGYIDYLSFESIDLSIHILRGEALIHKLLFGHI